MTFSSLALTPIKLIRPRRTSHALLGKFVEGLADKFGPGKSSMNPKRFAAALYYRSDTGVFLTVCRVGPARAISPKIETEDEGRAVLLPLEDFRRENDRDEI